jgi:hypothetical protein
VRSPDGGSLSPQCDIAIINLAPSSGEAFLSPSAILFVSVCCSVSFRPGSSRLCTRRPSLESPRPSGPTRNNFSTTDSGRLSLYKLDGGSQPECNAHRDHRTGSVRNARQGPANPENSWRIGAPLVGSRTYAPKRYERLGASHGRAQDSKRGLRGVSYHERMPMMLG